jgi:hypothetical protein
MNALLFIYALALFFVLTPNVLVKIPMKGSKYLVAAVHALIFAVVWIVTYRFLAPVAGKAPVHTPAIEGMTPGTASGANNYNVDILSALLTGYKNNNPNAVASINAIMADQGVQAQIQQYIKAHPIPGAASGPVASAVKATVAASPTASAKVAAVKAAN